jgi:hypothetical protein
MESEEELKKDIIDFSRSGRFPKMWRLVYRDGTLSQDFYNRARAREHYRLSQVDQKRREFTPSTANR